jgi:four helix bundle protein
MRVADYKDLRVYKLAFESAMEIFELSRRWPSEEKFSLTDQVRRSSRSVCANIAEAWRKRRYEAAFISKLSDSDGEAAETEVHLAFALRCGYLPPDKHRPLMDQYDHICRQLRKMMDDAPSWCGTGGELREMPAEYFVEAWERGSVEASERESVERQPTLRCSDAPRTDAPHAPDVPRPKRDDSRL